MDKETIDDYEYWAKQMRERGLSYGADDIFIAQLEAENAGRVSLLARAVEELYSVQDRGPIGEGWKSDELMSLIGEIEKEVSVVANDSPER